MVIDCHVHVCAASPGHGSLSESLLKSLPFRFMQWRLGIGAYGPETERAMEAKLAETIAQTEKLNAAYPATVLAWVGSEAVKTKAMSLWSALPVSTFSESA